MSSIGEFCFGKRYLEAHVAKIEQSEEITQKMFEWAKKPKNIFFFCGNVGNGKTYFAAAWYNLLKENNKNVRVFTENQLFTYLQGFYTRGEDADYELKRICQCDYMILDDMGSSKPSEWRSEVLLNFLNYRFNDSLPTLITSNLTKTDMVTGQLYHARFISRLFNPENTIVQVNGPDRRQENTL